MNPYSLRIRRATVEDRAALRTLWLSMRLPADELEGRLTEFQVVETGGEVAGALGLQILGTAALLHSEGYADFAIADAARELFGERIKALASNHGVFRLWTRENSPFWLHWGFQPADDEILSRLPEPWRASDGKWLTLELKDERAVNNALKDQFATFMADEKKQAIEVSEKARKITTFLSVMFFLVGIIGFAAAIYLFMRLRASAH